MYSVVGSDVSFYQVDDSIKTDVKHINFDRMADILDFVIIRAGQGAWLDRWIVRNWQHAKAAGLPRGSYWFYDSRTDPKLQAENYLTALGNDLGELPMFADFEDRYGGQYHGWKHWYTFLERLKVLAPNKEIGIYTGYYYWKENTVSVGIPNASLNYFKQYPLWIAQYKVTKPSIPAPWGDWTLWQYTDEGDGKAHGAQSLELDMNYFNGDKVQFKEHFGLDEVVVPPKKKIALLSFDGLTVEYKEK